MKSTQKRPSSGERLDKAGSLGSGVGSRGGHVIGTTKSGKPIYSSSHSKYSEVGSGLHEDVDHHHFEEQHPGYTKEDHLDAADAHDKQPGAKSTNVSMGHALAAIFMKKSARALLKAHLWRAN